MMMVMRAFQDSNSSSFSATFCCFACLAAEFSAAQKRREYFSAFKKKIYPGPTSEKQDYFKELCIKTGYEKKVPRHAINLDSTFATVSATNMTSFIDDDDHHPRRRICEEGCRRPINVCLCHTIPEKPIPTLTKVVILHHPHEQRHKLATVPVLSKCLQNCEVIVGRKLRYGDSKTLDYFYDHAVQNPNCPLRAIYLFPGKDAFSLTKREQGKLSTFDFDVNGCVLIAFDGTWKHAKEMLQASLQFLSKFSVQACLDYDAGTDGGTIYDSDLILRREPFGGCMSTMEAVARCLRHLDPNGICIESSLIEVLKEMVKFQSSFLKPMKPRPKLSRKVKEEVKKIAEHSEFPA